MRFILERNWFFFLSDVFLSDSSLEVKFNRANWRDLGEPRGSL